MESCGLFDEPLEVKVILRWRLFAVYPGNAGIEPVDFLGEVFMSGFEGFQVGEQKHFDSEGIVYPLPDEVELFEPFVFGVEIFAVVGTETGVEERDILVRVIGRQDDLDIEELFRGFGGMGIIM